MPDSPSTEVVRTLKFLVKGLSSLFWSLPLIFIISIHTAIAGMPEPFSFFPILASITLFLYSLHQLKKFKQDKNGWQNAVDKAFYASFIMLWLCPYLHWWHKVPENSHITLAVNLYIVFGLISMLFLNKALALLVVYLPDETIKTDTQIFSDLNRQFIVSVLVIFIIFVVLDKFTDLKYSILPRNFLLGGRSLWLLTFSILIIVSITMGLVWKIKEFIFSSVFSQNCQS